MAISRCVSMRFLDAISFDPSPWFVSARQSVNCSLTCDYAYVLRVNVYTLCSSAWLFRPADTPNGKCHQWTRRCHEGLPLRCTAFSAGSRVSRGSNNEKIYVDNVMAFPFFHCVASPFHSFVTTVDHVFANVVQILKSLQPCW